MKKIGTNGILAIVITVSLLVSMFSFMAYTATADANVNVHSGNASLRVNKGAVRANCTGLSLTGGVVYTLTYWVKTEANIPVGVTLSTDVQGVYPQEIVDKSSEISAGGYSANTPTDANWHQYSATFTPVTTSSNYAFGIDCRPTASDFYIDDVVLTAADSTTNLVVDGDFENAIQAHFGGSDTGWNTADWVDNCWYSEYAFQVYPAAKALYIEGAPTVTPSSSSSAESSSTTSSEAPPPPILPVVGTPGDVHYGYRSLKVDKRGPAAACTGLSLTSGTVYTLSYWVKTEANASVGVVFGTDVQGSGTFTDLTTQITSGGGYNVNTAADANWHQYTATITPTSTATDFYISIDSRPTDTTPFFFIDDVVLTAAGKEDKNLVADSGFETATQAHFGGNGNDWMTANWVDNCWVGQYASSVHQYGQPDGAKNLYILASPTAAIEIGLAENVHSGFRSIRVDARAVDINYSDLTLTKDKTYIFTYWAKGDGDHLSASFGTWESGVYPAVSTDLGNDVIEGGYAQITAPANAPANVTDLNWHKYTAKIVPSIDSAIFTVAIDFRGCLDNFYIDDVSLVEEGTTANLIADGDFESATQAHLKGDGQGWPTANWIDNRWFSPYAFAVHQYGQPGGEKAIAINVSPTLVVAEIPSSSSSTVSTTSTSSNVSTANSSNSNNGTSSSVPDTGDSYLILIFISLIICSTSVIVLIKNKKLNQN
jgi:uncharacterized protein YaiE (UPF0345 family)